MYTKIQAVHETPFRGWGKQRGQVFILDKQHDKGL